MKPGRKPQPIAAVGPDLVGPGHASRFRRDGQVTVTAADLRQIWPIVERHVAGAINDAPLWELLAFTYTVGVMHGRQLQEHAGDDVPMVPG